MMLAGDIVAGLLLVLVAGGLAWFAFRSPPEDESFSCQYNEADDE